MATCFPARADPRADQRYGVGARQVSSQALRACQSVRFGVGLRASAEAWSACSSMLRPASCVTCSAPGKLEVETRHARRTARHARRSVRCPPRLFSRFGPRLARLPNWPRRADGQASQTLRCWCPPGLKSGTPCISERAVWCGGAAPRARAGRASSTVRMLRHSA